MLDPVDLISMSSWARRLLSGTASFEEDSRAIHNLDLVVVFSGYLDAGNVATQIENALLERLEHQRLAPFDIDQLLDYRARRPQVRLDGRRFSDYEAPPLERHLVRDQMQRPFLLLTGPARDSRRDRFVAA